MNRSRENLAVHAELELAKPTLPANVREILASQLEEVHRLSGIVADMLFLSQVDRGAAAQPSATHDLAQLARDVAEYLNPLGEETDVTIAVTGQASAAVDPNLVRRALTNLLTNALRYAAPGSQVIVNVTLDGEQAAVEVSNCGAHVGDETLRRMFERFYRADPSRTGSASRHGLGLAIVAAVARMHGGGTAAESHDGLTKVGFTVLRSAQRVSP